MWKNYFTEVKLYRVKQHIPDFLINYLSSKLSLGGGLSPKSLGGRSTKSLLPKSLDVGLSPKSLGGGGLSPYPLPLLPNPPLSTPLPLSPPRPLKPPRSPRPPPRGSLKPPPQKQNEIYAKANLFQVMKIMFISKALSLFFFSSY